MSSCCLYQGLQVPQKNQVTPKFSFLLLNNCKKCCMLNYEEKSNTRNVERFLQLNHRQCSLLPVIPTGAASECSEMETLLYFTLVFFTKLLLLLQLQNYLCRLKMISSRKIMSLCPYKLLFIFFLYLFHSLLVMLRPLVLQKGAFHERYSPAASLSRISTCMYQRLGLEKTSRLRKFHVLSVPFRSVPFRMKVE